MKICVYAKNEEFVTAGWTHAEADCVRAGHRGARTDRESWRTGGTGRRGAAGGQPLAV